MKAKINLENKAKLFALYLGNGMVVPEKPKHHYYPFDHNEGGLKLDGILKSQIIVLRISEQVRDVYEQCCLSLKPLSSISDKECIELAKICWNDNNWNVLAGKEAAHSIECQSGFDFIPLQSIDFLRSKGYALPWMALSVKEMVDAGWIKLIES